MEKAMSKAAAEAPGAPALADRYVHRRLGVGDRVAFGEEFERHGREYLSLVHEPEEDAEEEERKPGRDGAVRQAAFGMRDPAFEIVEAVARRRVDEPRSGIVGDMIAREKRYGKRVVRHNAGLCDAAQRMLCDQTMWLEI